MKTKKIVATLRTGKYRVAEVLRSAFYRSVAQVLRAKLYLPSEQELIEEIEREKALIVREREVRYD